MPRYDFDDGTAEREPLDNAYRSHTPNPPEHYQDNHYHNDAPQPYYPEQDPRPQQYPDAHADPSFNHLRAERRNDRQGPPPAAVGAVGGAAAAGYAAHAVSPIDATPQVPPHRDWGPDRYAPAPQPNLNPNITPGADNFSDTASGGMAGIAYTVAERNARESGVDAMRNVGQAPPQARGQFQQPPNAPPQAYNQPRGDAYEMTAAPRPYPGSLPDRDSHSSLTALGGAGASPARLSPASSPYGYNDYYNDNPYYQRHPGHLGVVDPNSIADDGDDGLEYGRSRSGRNSMLSLSNSDRTGRSKAAAAGAAAAGGAAATGLMANRNVSGYYDPKDVATGYQNGSAVDLGGQEKSEWLRNEKKSGKKWKICIIVAVVLVIIGAITGGIVGGLVSRSNREGGSSKSGQGQSADDDKSSNGDLNINSSEIKELMNNKQLHKVFPGMDYTPINTQYPECIHNPPSQNNITRDLAVLSQLTNTIRLYGTDCNQTQMLIHSIQQLKMEDTIKIWMGVWQDKNTTTNARQLEQMWDILDVYGDKYFEGVIVANEILFRQEMTEAALGNLLAEVRTNLTAKGLSLPVATSDLGDDWTASLAAKSDYIMANIHPFFSGTNANDAAMWTYAFWENQAGGFFKPDKKKNVIAEVGWPTKGGMNCGDGTAVNCPTRSVAGISELNELLDEWVCPALANGTNYFWFSAFDEPWKIKFNEKNKEWEDQWGLMDVNRNIKSGVVIPDCGGKTV
ncbi:endo-beta-1,3-glucanase [Colletotrichum higginsianum]|uniref:glucan endo-1,3-beta-D-glucosidase n=2 Tax=Colletotrichum higginsianum TaxID=80884 RepID=H1V3Z0_COLHI|nr:Endo-beta-1,3-glucanase [Colletotrichum higginsianum IMI 349063]OBR05676.1 Endo-beta-1,3-glucanase [Colletotrichum higginsianum IMI 349063]TIC90700.1 putative glucan endo-1,3-beta-glucosidase btgC [Colletotrichum higginsianum]CCF34942.1 endo-beta-1,3-glucanase [Colletotrichum higginsianum]